MRSSVVKKKDKDKNLQTIRYKTRGKRFEIAVYRDKMPTSDARSAPGFQWESILSDVLRSTDVFLNVAKNDVASPQVLETCFGDKNPEKACIAILEKGDVQLGEEERALLMMKDAELFSDVASIAAAKLVVIVTSTTATKEDSSDDEAAPKERKEKKEKKDKKDKKAKEVDASDDEAAPKKEKKEKKDKKDKKAKEVDASDDEAAPKKEKKEKKDKKDKKAKEVDASDDEAAPKKEKKEKKDKKDKKAKEVDASDDEAAPKKEKKEKKDKKDKKAKEVDASDDEAAPKKEKKEKKDKKDKKAKEVDASDDEAAPKKEKKEKKAAVLKPVTTESVQVSTAEIERDMKNLRFEVNKKLTPLENAINAIAFLKRQPLSAVMTGDIIRKQKKIVVIFPPETHADTVGKSFLDKLDSIFEDYAGKVLPGTVFMKQNCGQGPRVEILVDSDCFLALNGSLRKSCPIVSDCHVDVDNYLPSGRWALVDDGTDADGVDPESVPPPQDLTYVWFNGTWSLSRPAEVHAGGAPAEQPKQTASKGKKKGGKGKAKGDSDSDDMPVAAKTKKGSRKGSTFEEEDDDEDEIDLAAQLAKLGVSKGDMSDSDDGKRGKGKGKKGGKHQPAPKKSHKDPSPAVQQKKGTYCSSDENEEGSSESDASSEQAPTVKPKGRKGRR